MQFNIYKIIIAAADMGLYCYNFINRSLIIWFKVNTQCTSNYADIWRYLACSCLCSCLRVRTDFLFHEKVSNNEPHQIWN